MHLVLEDGAEECGGALQYIFLQCTMRRFFLFLPELAGRQPWTGSQCDCRCMLSRSLVGMQNVQPRGSWTSTFYQSFTHRPHTFAGLHLFAVNYDVPLMICAFDMSTTIRLLRGIF